MLKTYALYTVYEFVDCYFYDYKYLYFQFGLTGLVLLLASVI